MSEREFKKWEEREYFAPNFQERVAVMASLIGEEKSVLDLGCGLQSLKEYIPAGMHYIPVDYTMRSQDTVLCNFNKHEFPDAKAELIFASGVLEYINDYSWFITQIASHCNAAIVSYCSLDHSPYTAARRELSWVNDLKKRELIEIFESNAMHLIAEAAYSVNDIFKFVKKSG